MSMETEVERQVVGSYADTLKSVQSLIAAKVGAFGGERNWKAHSEGIRAIVEVNTFIGSAIHHLEEVAGRTEPPNNDTSDPLFSGAVPAGEGSYL